VAEAAAGAREMAPFFFELAAAWPIGYRLEEKCDVVGVICVAPFQDVRRGRFIPPESSSKASLIHSTRSILVRKLLLTEATRRAQRDAFSTEETAKELTIKAAKEKAAKEKAAKAKAEAMDEANKAEAKAKKSAAVKQAGTKQKIKEQAATEKQKAAAAPAKEDAPVKRCSVSFPGTCVVFVIAALFFAVTMALRSNSSMPIGSAEVVTSRSISSWANGQQSGLYDNNDSCAAQEAFETTCSVRLFFAT